MGGLASIAAAAGCRHTAAAMGWPGFLLFASDATLAAAGDGVLLVLAVLALVADWRRTRRRRIDAVGCVPWTALFLFCAISGVGLLTLAIQGWLRG
jgi:hypothetical protein